MKECLRERGEGRDERREEKEERGRVVKREIEGVRGRGAESGRKCGRARVELR